jgi:cation:H+ antiporter
MASSSRLSHPLVVLLGAVLVTVPWIGAWATGAADGFATLVRVAVSGVAVLGASFLLAWGAETAEKDVPRAFAIAVLAVLAVAPEYAVDALYAWNAGAQAGTPAGTEAANLAVANMTGANRILIGLGWSGIALFAFYRMRKSGPTPNVTTTDTFLGDYVQLDRDLALEILFLFVATVFAFFVPFNGGIDIVDTVVLVSLYLAYIAIIIRGGVEEVEEQVGVPAYFHERPQHVRIPVAILLFVFSGALIFTAVEPFAHGLEQLGVDYGVPKFFMIQWIAPLASESPELIVTAYLVNKARSTAAFNALISSKLNQWTLLIGTLAVVYSISLGSYGVLPFDDKQAAEIWITAAQSLFALALLLDFRISAREAVALLVLFVSQVLVEFVIIRTVPEAMATTYSIWLLYAYTAVYLLASVVLLAFYREDLRRVVRHSTAIIQDAWSRDAEQPAD